MSIILSNYCQGEMTVNVTLLGALWAKVGTENLDMYPKRPSQPCRMHPEWFKGIVTVDDGRWAKLSNALHKHK